MSDSKLIEKLNGGLGWELRAAALYAHYSAYVKGIHRLHLKPFFDEEATESHTHAEMVRAAIVKLGGTAVTDRDSTEIVHTTDYKTMLTAESRGLRGQNARRGHENNIQDMACNLIFEGLQLRAPSGARIQSMLDEFPIPC